MFMCVKKVHCKCIILMGKLALDMFKQVKILIASLCHAFWIVTNFYFMHIKY